MGHRDRDWSDPLRSAFVHGADVLDALAFKPLAGFVDTDNLRLKLLRERNSIMNMIEVPVRDQDRIDTIEGMLLRIRRVPLCPWIQYHDLARAESQLECPMTQPRDFDHSRS